MAIGERIRFICELSGMTRKYLGQIDGELCIHLDKQKGSEYISTFAMLSAWYEQEEQYITGENNREGYDR